MEKSKIKKTRYEKYCAGCGKYFIAASQHIYRVGTQFYCSWTCYLHRNDWEVKKDDKGGT